MLVGYLGLLVLWLLFSLFALLKKRHFRGFDVPARFCYGVLVLDQILIALRLWYVSSLLMIAMIIILLVLIGLVETGFRNKLQNCLSKQWISLIITVFLIDIMMTFLITIWN